MAVRKILGALVIILIGLPILFGMIWTVGLVKATVSAEFMSELPRKIIAELPDRMDEIFRAAQNEDNIADPDTRAWFRAAAESGFSPKELMAKTGLLDWMQGGLTDTLRQIGAMLRGEQPVRELSLDLRPLKKALLDPEMDRFLEATLERLPVCDERGLAAWQELAAGGGVRRRLPACRPGEIVVSDVLLQVRTRAVARIDDEVPVFENVGPRVFFRSGIARPVAAMSYALFLLPALFIFLGALVAASSPAGFLRWSGFSVLAGSLPVLVFAWLIKRFSLWAIAGGPWAWHSRWSSELGDLVLVKLRWIPLRIVDQLFSPVIYVAAVVAVVGVVLVALSYSVHHRAPAPKPS
jgi:hypothetical protein